MPVHAPWYPEFRTELLSFPAGKYDDQVDALGLVGPLLDKMMSCARKSAIAAVGIWTNLFAIAPSLGAAENLLVQVCRSPEYKQNHFLFGTVMGVATGMRVVHDGMDSKVLCFPNNVRSSELIEATCKYVRANPAQWNLDQFDLAAMAILGTYRCSK